MALTHLSPLFKDLSDEETGAIVGGNLSTPQERLQGLRLVCINGRCYYSRHFLPRFRSPMPFISLLRARRR
jgi:hypothetical protein